MTSHNEIQHIQQRADEITDQSLESTRRIKQMATEAENIGISTVVELNNQEESLVRIDQTLHTMDDDLKKADKNIKKMSAFCGLSFLSFRRTPKYMNENESYEKVVKKNYKKSKPKKDKSKSAKGEIGKISQPESYITRVTHDPREQEMDENLREIEAVVLNMKSIAGEISNSLDKQDPIIERISNKVTRNNDIIDEETKRTNKLIRGS